MAAVAAVAATTIRVGNLLLLLHWIGEATVVHVIYLIETISNGSITSCQYCKILKTHFTIILELGLKFNHIADHS